MTKSLEFMRYCVYSWLSSIRLHWQEIKYLEEQIQALRYRLEGMKSVSSDSVSGSKASDSLNDGIYRLEQLADDWEAKISLYANEYVDALTMCEADPNRYAVWVHIVERQPWGRVAKRFYYSESQVKRMRDIGIASIYELMPDEHRGRDIPNAID